MNLLLFMYLTNIQTHYKLLIFWLIRVPNSIFLSVEQLNRGVNADDVKVDISLSIIKPLHSKWVVDMLKFMKESKYLISSFRKAPISEAAAESATLINLCENPFRRLNW